MPLTRKDTQRQTRDRLIAAAHSSIIEEGVAAMSIRNICSAAGHSQGAFYSNFASKDDLLVEILQSHIQDEVTLLRDLVAHCSGDDIEATLQVLQGHVRLTAGDDAWEGKGGDYVAIPPRRHALHAVEDSVVMLTVLKSQPGASH